MKQRIWSKTEISKRVIVKRNSSKTRIIIITVV